MLEVILGVIGWLLFAVAASWLFVAVFVLIDTTRLLIRPGKRGS